MKYYHLIGALLLSSMLAACGGSSSGSNNSSASSVSSQSSALSTSSESSQSSVLSTSSESSQSSALATSSESSQSSALSTGSESSQSSASSTSSVAVDPVVCAETGQYFCDDFSAGNADQWNLLSATSNPTPQPNGAFDVPSVNGNNVLRFTAANRGGEIALVNPAAFEGVPSADYYVEARIRPRQNGTTGNKFLFLMARYQDAGNWYAAGLNVQNTVETTKVEIAKSVGGSITRPVQVSREIIQGTAGSLDDGQWYTVRFELIGNTLSLYFEGEKVGQTTDATYAERGLIGLYTANKSFEIDDITVGDPANKPTQLTISPSSQVWVAEAETDDYVVAVTAVQSNGDPDTFTVESSDPSVVGVAVDGNSVSLSPLAEGTAAITFSSGSDANLKRTINATISPAFSQPVATYNLTGRTVPAVAEVDTLRDTRLRLTFDSAPTLGDAGSIRLYKVSDNSVADNVSVIGETDSLPALDRSRTLNTEQVWVEGNTLVVAPHFGVLEPGTEYYVAIANGVVNGTLNGETFVGMGENAGWTFTTTATAPTGSDVTVATTGAADFRTLQGALHYVMFNVAQNDPATITLQDGVYQEPLYLRNKNNLTIQGQSRDGTVIQYRNNNTVNPGTSERTLFLVESADMLVLQDLTIRNTTLIADGQAETIYFNSPHRLIVKNAAFYSEQDTLLLKGYAWFYQSLVAGSVDFIWGSNHVTLFEESEIRTIGRSTGTGGYILQARTMNATDKGFVFLNSELTRGLSPTGTAAPADNTIPLARSGGSTAYYDNIVFVNTKMDSHITTAGWHTSPLPNPNPATATSGWREYNSMNLAGDPLDTSGRWSGAYTLSEAEYLAEFSTREQIFSAYGTAGWNPQP